MNFSDFELYPGVVTNGKDPEKYGRIKCVIAGHTNNIDPEDFYWCAPFMTFGYQRVSQPSVGQTVWIIHNKNNAMEYYWLPRWELNANTALAVNDDDYDVLVSRPGVDTGAQMYYTDGQGFVQRINQNVESTMTQNSITHNHSGMGMTISEGGINLGTIGEDHQPMVRGNDLVKVLEKICEKLDDLSQTSSNSWTTAHLSTDVVSYSSQIKPLIDAIKSDKAFVN
ncbi:MAG: hypothetical protein J1F35_06250 [Erysipelotrichales bacterium]|nr:hypothetical protein [Erysipelotrichales bacterium]